MTHAADTDARIERLVAYYTRAAERMRDMPVCNGALEVEAVGFREHLGRSVGVIVTPWFMNVVVLPSADDGAAWREGRATRIPFPSGTCDFVVNGAGENGLVASYSLFPLMHEFADAAAARTAALAALSALFEPTDPAISTPPPGQGGTARVFSRRKLFGG